MHIPVLNRLHCFVDDDYVFDVGNGEPANFKDGTVKLSVNGTLKEAHASAMGQTVGAFIKAKAQQYGVRTFNVYADGEKLTHGDADNQASDYNVIEIVAKDSRGIASPVPDSTVSPPKRVLIIEVPEVEGSKWEIDLPEGLSMEHENFIRYVWLLGFKAAMEC